MIGGWWRLGLADEWLMAVGSGWRLAVGRRWLLVAVGGWRLAVGGWRLAIDLQQSLDTKLYFITHIIHQPLHNDDRLAPSSMAQHDTRSPLYYHC